MGYDLHITRADDWRDLEGHQISSEEWLAYVKNDPSLTLRGESVWPFEAIWSGDDVCGKSEYPEAWLDWLDGYVYTKNPDRPVIKKMVLIARVLNAKVQGDDGEIYLWDEVHQIQ